MLAGTSKTLVMRIVIASALLVLSSAILNAAFSAVNIENDYIGLSIGVSGTIDGDIGHTQISNQPPVAGRFAIYTTGGDPTVPEDDYSDMIWAPAMGVPGDKWGALEIQVDGYDDEGLHVWANFEEGGAYSGIWGSETDGVWDVAPHRRTDKHNFIYGSWYPVSSDLGLIPVRCEQSARIMHETVRFEWTFTNEDIRDHYIGAKVYGDVVTGLIDGGTWGTQKSVASVPGFPLIEEKTLLSGSYEIPDFIEFFNSARDPIWSVRASFKGNGATMPDKVGVDDWFGSVTTSAWTYHYNPLAPQDGMLGWTYEPLSHHYISDIAYGAIWKPRRVSPGQSRKIVHYIGLAACTADLAKPSENDIQYAAAVQGPRCLKYYTDENQQKVYPDPFIITAYLENLERSMDFQNASFTLILPPGLALDESENNHYTKTLTTVPAASEKSVSWKVKTTGTPRGIMNYSVVFSAYPAVGTTVTRTINIPATSQQPLSWRWQMISVPFETSNTLVEDVLGIPSDWERGTSGDLKDWALVEYHPEWSGNKWDWNVSTLEPGKGYWLYLARPHVATIPEGMYRAREWEGTQGSLIPLQQGWNLVGNPYIYAVTFGEIKFYHRNYGVIGWGEAVSKRFIGGTVFSWNTAFQRWDMMTRRSAQMKPWQGYWLKVYTPDLVMIITPSAQIGAAIGGTPVSGGEDEGGTTPPTP